MVRCNMVLTAEDFPAPSMPMVRCNMVLTAEDFPAPTMPSTTMLGLVMTPSV